MKKVLFNCKEDLHKKVRILAAEHDVTMSEIINAGIEKMVKYYDKKGENTKTED